MATISHHKNKKAKKTAYTAVSLNPPGVEGEDGAKQPTDAIQVEKGQFANEDASSVDNKPKRETRHTVGLFEVFRFATGLDIFLMAAGILAAAFNGLIQPLTVVVFGNILDRFTDPTQSCAFLDLMRTNETIKEWYTNSTHLFNFTCEGLASQNESSLMDIVIARLGRLPLDEQEPYWNFFDWAFEHGFFNQTLETCMGTINAQNSFLSNVGDQCIFLIIIAALSWFFAFIQNATWGMAAENQVKAIRSAFFLNLIRQDVGWYDQQESGAVVSKFAEDILLIQKGIGVKFGLFFQCIAAFFAGMFIAFAYGWELALVVLSLSPLLIADAIMLMKVSIIQAQDETKAYAKAGAVAQEVLGSIRTVASFGGQLREVERYAANLDEARKFGTKKGFILGLMMGLSLFIVFGSYALGFSYGVKLINDERPDYSIGIILTTFFSVITGTYSLGMTITSIQSYAAARSAAYSVFRIIDRKPEIDAFSNSGKTYNPEDTFDCRIEFKNVFFRYPTRPDVHVLNDVSLTIEPGTTVALVGASGCGKSTIFQLLQRFYDPDAGSVLIDGFNLRDYNLFWFRSTIGSVSQEPALFDTSIFENIRYGYPLATKEEIEEAAKIANAHDFITKLPNGYETLVGEQGAQLSGGQKQRIAIARALVRNPAILLLDEATSALDTESEAIVQEALDRVRSGRTTIAIAHRLSTIMDADKIIVIDAGKIVETGRHAELIAKGGIYAKLVEAQKGRDFAEIDMEFNSARERRAAFVRTQKQRIGSSNSGESPAHSPLIEQTSFFPPLKQEIELPEVEIVSSFSERRKSQQTLVKNHYSFRRLWSLALAEMPFFMLGTLGSLFCGAIWPTFSIIFSRMLNAFSECDKEARSEKGLFYSLIFLAIGFCAFVGSILMMGMFSYAGERLVARIRKMTFHAMLRQESAWFDDKDNSLGALSSRLATKCGQVRDATGSQLAQLVQNTSSFIAAVIIAFIFEWRITLIMLGFVPFLVVGGLVQGRAAGDTVSQDKFIESAANYLVQSTTNIRTVTALGLYHIFIDLFSAPLKARHKRELVKINIAAFCFGMSEATSLFAYAAAFYAGSEFVKQGLTNLENMFTALAAILFSAFAVGQANAMASDQKKAQIAIAEIFKLLDRNPAIRWEESAGRAKPDKFFGNIALEKVEFHYPTRPTVPILRGLDIKILPGQTVALVGASGCGKSTVIQLLERFYDPTKGEIKVNDAAMPSLSLPWVRSKMALVSQEPILFDRTIAENISYGLDGLRGSTVSGMTATKAEIELAARQANIHDFIMTLPDGYETRVGERGAQLSGGQKQRIAIARALIRKPQLLLLDEATSALDSESEKIVQEALDRARTGRTVLVIAHRLSTIEGADVIAVIKAGVVREIGTHSDLLEKRGLYYRLWSAQQLTD